MYIQYSHVKDNTLLGSYSCSCTKVIRLILIYECTCAVGLELGRAHCAWGAATARQVWQVERCTHHRTSRSPRRREAHASTRLGRATARHLQLLVQRCSPERPVPYRDARRLLYDASRRRSRSHSFSRLVARLNWCHAGRHAASAVLRSRHGAATALCAPSETGAALRLLLPALAHPERRVWLLYSMSDFYLRIEFMNWWVLLTLYCMCTFAELRCNSNVFSRRFQLILL